MEEDKNTSKTEKKIILESAKEWCKYDPNPITSKYVNDLITKSNSGSGGSDDAAAAVESSSAVAMKELSTLFPNSDDKSSSKRISFGTAGLRSSMTPGPFGMNDLTVIQTAQGLAKYCLSCCNGKEAEDEDQDQDDDDETTPVKKKQKITHKLRAIVGYDHRSNPKFGISSSLFAILTKLVFEHVGIDCIVLDGYMFTPLVPYTLQTMEASVGIMITASHNPKLDAGYKVYAKDGCQIRSPMDEHISGYINQNLIPWKNYYIEIDKLKKTVSPSVATSSTDSSSSVDSDSCHNLGLTDIYTTQEMLSSYYKAITTSGLLIRTEETEATTNGRKFPKIAYTAMHGVGYPYAKRVFEEFQLQPFLSVKQQQDPDPNFPTVYFPNPEEKGALNIAKTVATQNGCNIILANDPDADRLAVAEFDEKTNEWIIFHGDQIGAMLGLWIWEHVGKKCNKPVSMCASTVSSKLLAEIARVEGFKFEDTLTGFKWIGSRASELTKKEGYRNLFAYEEAIGFCCGDVIFDKDGICAMAVFTQLASYVYQTKCMSLKDHMQEIYNRYGEFVSYNGYYIMNDKKSISIIMDHIRGQNGTYNMDYLGPKYQVESIRDLGVPGYDSMMEDKKPKLPTSNSSPMITIRFTNGCVAQFRASGTEPKFKYYIEMKGQPGVPRSTVEKDLKIMVDAILDQLLIPSESGFTLPSNA